MFCLQQFLILKIRSYRFKQVSRNHCKQIGDFSQSSARPLSFCLYFSVFYFDIFWYNHCLLHIYPFQVLDSPFSITFSKRYNMYNYLILDKKSSTIKWDIHIQIFLFALIFQDITYKILYLAQMVSHQIFHQHLLF